MSLNECRTKSNPRTRTIFGAGSKENSEGTNEGIGHIQYTYGSAGRIEYMRYRWNQGEMDQLLVYDSDLHQKLEVTSNVNFISAKIKTQNAQLITNALNQYTEITNNGQKQTLTYDEGGNLKSFDGWTYKHNALGQFVEAKKESVTATYTYDVLGRRNSKTVNGITTNYLWAGNQEIAEYDGDWWLTRRYVPGTGLDEVVAMVEGQDVRYYPLTDKIGSVIGLLNEKGELVEKHAYNAFGVEVTRGDTDPLDGIVLGTPRFCAADVVKKNPVCQQQGVASSEGLLVVVKQEGVQGELVAFAQGSIPPHLNPLNDKGYAFRFVGRRYDPETGLYYNRARYYSPMLGRFLQPDPLGVSGGLNLYAYANNNPLSYTDPMGMFGGLPGAGAGALFGAGSAYFSDPQNATWQSVMAGAVVAAVAGATSSWMLARLPFTGIPAANIIAGRAGINVAANATAGAFSTAAGDYINTGSVDVKKAAIMGAITGAVPLITGEAAIVAAASGLRKTEETLIHSIWGGYSAAIATGFQYGVNQAIAERQVTGPVIQNSTPIFLPSVPRK